MERKVKEGEIWKPSSRLKWYYENREKALRQNKEWRANNRERKKEINRKSNLKNREKVLARAKKYRDANRDEIRKRGRIATKRWHENNKEYHKKLNKEWVRKNPERVKELAKEWIKNNPEKMSAMRLNANAKRRAQKHTGKVSASDWAKIKGAANYRCHYCKKKKYLTMDHVTPLSKGGHHVSSNIVPACQSCNSSKGNKIINLL